jgi:hypothetical protein
MKFQRKSAGRDAGKNNLQMVTSSDGNRYIEEWTGKVGKIADKRTRRKAWADAEEYPILIDTAVSVGIAADADDVREVFATAAAVNTLTGTQKIGIGRYNATAYHGGVRFDNLAIPIGAKVISAYIILFSSNGRASQGSFVKVYADDADDAAAFTNSDPPSGIDKTAGKFTFPAAIPIGIIHAEMTDAVQTVVNRTGWTSGNAMRFALLDVATSGVITQVSFYDYPNPGYATLDVTYSFGGVASMARVRVGH